MDKYLDEKIKKLEILLDRDALSTYDGGMLDAYKDVKRQLALCNVVGRSEQYAYECMVCGETFENNDGLCEHYDNKHN